MKSKALSLRSTCLTRLNTFSKYLVIKKKNKIERSIMPEGSRVGLELILSFSFYLFFAFLSLKNRKLSKIVPSIEFLCQRLRLGWKKTKKIGLREAKLTVQGLLYYPCKSTFLFIATLSQKILNRQKKKNNPKKPFFTRKERCVGGLYTHHLHYFRSQVRIFIKLIIILYKNYYRHVKRILKIGLNDASSSVPN